MPLDIDKLMDKMPKEYLDKAFDVASNLFNIELTEEQKQTFIELVQSLEDNKGQIQYFIEHLQEIFEALIYLKNIMGEYKELKNISAKYEHVEHE